MAFYAAFLAPLRVGAPAAAMAAPGAGAGAVGVAAGGYAGYAVLGDGKVMAWGDDLEGQIGSGGDWSASALPVAVGPLRNIVALAAGTNTAYALAADGAVFAWGDNAQQELGDVRATSSDVPDEVHGLTGIVAIAAGGFSADALAGDGTVFAWGDNSFGQLGVGTALGLDAAPRRVPGLRGVVALAAGEADGYALAAGGTVWAWGDDAFGELGGRTCPPSGHPGGTGAPAGVSGGGRCTPPVGPVEVRGLPDVVAIAAGSDTAYALGSDGTVWAWGDDAFGELGEAATGAFSARPVEVRHLSGVVAIAAGAYSGYALTAGGTLWSWGAGASGQLGDGTTVASDLPVRVEHLAPAAQIAGGGDIAYALLRDGTVWSFGDGSYGQLGDGNESGSAVPVRVLGLGLGARSSTKTGAAATVPVRVLGLGAPQRRPGPSPQPPR